MADQFGRGSVVSRAGTDAQIDEGLRAYMLRVYNYMVTGLALTGAVAYIVASTPALAQVILGTPLFWGLLIVEIGLVFYLSARVMKMSFSKAQFLFWLYAGVNGLTFSVYLLAYTGESVARVFFIAAGTFAAMSLYGYTTKRDLTGWRSFLVMGLIGVIIAMVVNFIFPSSLLGFAIPVIGVLVMVGFTAYDTQKIKELYYEGDGAETAGKKAVIGALKLYLDFILLFVFLLQLLGNRN